MTMSELFIAHSDAAVFVKPYAIEYHGHVGAFESDEQRVTSCECTCGWTFSAHGCDLAVDVWRLHIDSERRHHTIVPAPETCAACVDNGGHLQLVDDEGDVYDEVSCSHGLPPAT